MRVRNVEESDIQQIKNIASTAFKLHRYWTDNSLDRKSVEDYYIAEIDNFKKELSENKDRFNIYVAEDGGQVLGYIVLRIDELLSSAFKQRWGIIASFALRSDSRGKGIGSILLAKALEWFREKGAERIDVSTDAENIAAIQCYEKYGFRTVYAGVTLTKVLEKRARL
jgi:ribosomal protein S18 acetylase RimI-like enzyme